MPNSQYIHFVGGFANKFKSSGKKYTGDSAHQLLSDLELLSIESFRRVYPQARVLCHTAEGSWQNVPDYAERIEYLSHQYGYWPNWEIRFGAHMSDRIRLAALLRYGGLYADTDVYALKQVPFLKVYQGEDKVWLTSISARPTKPSFCNGVFAAGKPNATFLQAWWERYTKSPNSAGEKTTIRNRFWDGLSCRVPTQMALSPELQDFVVWETDCSKVHGLGHNRIQWQEEKDFPKKLKDAYMVHCINTRQIVNQPDVFGTNTMFHRFINYVRTAHAMV